MTIAASTLSPVPALRDWFRSACRHFVPNPPPRRPSGQRDARALLQTAAHATGPTAGSSPTSVAGAEPDSRRGSAAADIAAEDWDLLFRAALELLAQVAVEKATPEGMRTRTRLQAPGTALLECIDALNQLRRSVPPHGI